MLRGILLFLLSSIMPAVEALTEFSADVSYFDSENPQPFTGRIFVSNSAIREERSGSRGETIHITDLLVEPHMY